MLLETICIENRQIRNADFHNRRLNTTREQLFGITLSIDIRDLIKIPIGMGMGIYKCRVIYDQKIREVQVLPHQPRRIQSLKIVEDNDIDYAYKYADRSRLEALLGMKENRDDILIVKDGCLTDTSFSNIIFQTVDGAWITPDTPLLEGTMRQFLLEEGVIRETRIGLNDLYGFSQARLINCMMDMETGQTIEMEQIT